MNITIVPHTENNHKDNQQNANIEILLVV